MPEQEREELLAGYLAGEIDEAGCDTLASELLRDKAFALESAKLSLIDCLPGQVLDRDADRHCVERVTDEVRREATSRQFTQQVMAELKQDLDACASSFSSASAGSLPLRVMARIPWESSWEAAVASRHGALTNPNRIVIRKKPSRRKLVVQRSVSGWAMKYVAVPLVVAALLVLCLQVYLRHVLQQELGVHVARIDRAGTLQIKRQDAWAPLGVGDMPAPGSYLRLNIGNAVLAYGDGTRLKLGEDLEMTLAGPAPLARQLAFNLPGKATALHQGAVELQVAPQPRNKPMRIETAHAVTTVLGTELVLLERASKSRIEVLQGQVKVTRIADGNRSSWKRDRPPA